MGKILTSFVICSFLFPFSEVEAQWKQDEFIIGTYLDPRLSANQDSIGDSIRFQSAKDSYFNLLTGFQSESFSFIDRDTTGMRYALDVSSKTGLKYLISDERFFNLAEFDKEKGQKVVEHYAKLPPRLSKSLWGYRLIDEPSLSDSTRVLSWAYFFKRTSPAQLAYVNLLPRYGFETDKAYEFYLDTYLGAKVNGKFILDVVSFDHYPVEKKGIRNSYFYNLEIVRKKSEGRPFWAYPLTTAHLDYPDPTLAELRFMAHCPLIYGAKGLIYFTYETTLEKEPIKYGDALILKDGYSKSKKFYYVKEINQKIADLVGPLIMKSEYVGTFHTSNYPDVDIPEENKISPNTPLIAYASNNKIAFGIFRDTLDSSILYLLIVNKSFKKASPFKVILYGNYESSVSELITSKEEAQISASFYPRDNRTSLSVNEMEGGDIKIFRLVNQSNLSHAKFGSPEKAVSIYPIPVIDNSIIKYYISEPSFVGIKIFDINGIAKRVLLQEYKSIPGTYYTTLDKEGLSSGVYFCEIIINKEVIIKTLIIN